jgi:hypothetical protein
VKLTKDNQAAANKETPQDSGLSDGSLNCTVDTYLLGSAFFQAKAISLGARTAKSTTPRSATGWANRNKAMRCIIATSYAQETEAAPSTRKQRCGAECRSGDRWREIGLSSLGTVYISRLASSFNNTSQHCHSGDHIILCEDTPSL